MSDPNRRVRPRMSEHIQVIRSLWLLREQARVQAAERCFLADLERLLSARVRPSGFSTTTTARTVDAEHIYESVPPPRTQDAPVREQLSEQLLEQELGQLLSAQRVTNLSPEFRALLEGNSIEEEYTTSPHQHRRAHSELSSTRFVSTALDSAFRHQLESVLVRRDGAEAAQQLRSLYTRDHNRNPHINNINIGTTTTTNTDILSPNNADLDSYMDMDMTMDVGNSQQGQALRAVVRALQDEVIALKGVIGASFDLQLDIQRSIRQEVAAAMQTPSRLSISKPTGSASSSSTVAEDTSTCSSVPNLVESEKKKTFDDAKTAPVTAGTCSVCMEAKIDSLLYACGHMCTCVMCGRQLIAAGQPCPICRAPVRDVVRAFAVTD